MRLARRARSRRRLLGEAFCPARTDRGSKRNDATSATYSCARSSACATHRSARATSRRRSGTRRKSRSWSLSGRAVTAGRRRRGPASAGGNPAEALRVYERCRRLLADELGAYPSPETESIYRDLLRAPTSEDRAALPETGLSEVVLEPARAGGPETASPRIRRRRRLPVAIGAGLLLALGLAASVVAFTGGGTAEQRTAAPKQAVVIRPE